MRWLIQDDEAVLSTSSPNLMQRFALASIHFSAREPSQNFVSTEPNWLSSSNECLWLGINCTDVNGMDVNAVETMDIGE